MPPVVRSVTCVGPAAPPSVTVADTMPLASEANEAPLNVTDGAVCQITGTLANGAPLESSTRAVSGAGRRDPAGPDWLFPPVIRRTAGTPAPPPPPPVGGGVL